MAPVAEVHHLPWCRARIQRGSMGWLPCCRLKVGAWVLSLGNLHKPFDVQQSRVTLMYHQQFKALSSTDFDGKLHT